MNKNVIITIAMYDPMPKGLEYAIKTQKEYADRFNCEHIVIRKGNSAPHWAKFDILQSFILDAKDKWDRLLYLDADVVCNQKRDIFNRFKNPYKGFYACQDWVMWWKEHDSYRQSIKDSYGIEVDARFRYVNTGVWMVDKETAQDIIKLKDALKPKPPADQHFAEQTYFNLLLYLTGVPILLMPQSFNLFKTESYGYDDDVNEGNFHHFVGPDGTNQLTRIADREAQRNS